MIVAPDLGDDFAVRTELPIRPGRIIAPVIIGRGFLLQNYCGGIAARPILDESIQWGLVLPVFHKFKIDNNAIPKSTAHEMAQIESATVSKKVRRMLGLALDSWNNLMVAFLAVGALAAAIVGVSTFAIIKLQKLEAADASAAFEQYKLGVAAQVADANARAAEANQKAEAERLERVKLQEKLAWRSLNEEQQQRIVTKIKEFAGQQYLLGVSNDPDSLNFLKTIDSILQSAGWIKLPPVGNIILEEDGASIAAKLKIAVQAAPSRASDFGPRITALSVALNAEGIAAYPAQNPELENNPNAITIIVGSKPE